MISPLAELRQKWIVSLYERRVGWMERRVARSTSREQYVDWVSGAALLAYRADLEAVRLLDERYFLYTEDVDLCAAIRARAAPAPPWRLRRTQPIDEVIWRSTRSTIRGGRRCCAHTFG